MTTLDHAPHEGSSTSFNLFGSARRALRLAYHAMRMRSDRAALQAMPDYLLKDMGISRSQIDHYTSTHRALAEAGRTDG